MKPKTKAVARPMPITSGVWDSPPPSLPRKGGGIPVRRELTPRQISDGDPIQQAQRGPSSLAGEVGRGRSPTLAKKSSKLPALAVSTALLALAPLAAPQAALAMGESATAQMKSADGKDLGTVTLTETMAGVLLKVSLKGVAPGPHGFHVHAAGKCEGDFSSAGPIYNPFGAQHGILNPEGPMAGNLPNLVATASGEVAAEMLSGSSITLSKTSEDPLLDADGAALVIFEQPGDHMTEPEGNAGARVACGVIEAK